MEMGEEQVTTALDGWRQARSRWQQHWMEVGEEQWMEIVKNRVDVGAEGQHCCWSQRE